MNVLGIMGKMYKGLQQPQKAVDTYQARTGHTAAVGRSHGGSGNPLQRRLTERDRGNVQEARTHIEHVMTIVEDIRTKVTSQDLRTSDFASVKVLSSFTSTC